ncbi:williams-beuren syndrome critical region protein, putative [Entamoeba invadens IP1]|uniref:Williams-beuren syndrome critical region protein, putative n=1 Tax=Entamoeba invadens IP1 TaxID=370355 RepID=L7FMZ8_ENTIV|nr:williams-beuren syndrome critical region protein, putative [Entamoeba invadens IP1]ELP92398.1 williams-beuren syndrome critical region protein, putative [Entamoeba invadens IP1]|eukprot:XP_004259169.1 williams-beuren syndrome critical region protein, putative [Entamoeba invadens IP1]
MSLNYKQAAKVIEKVLKKKCSVKTAIYQDDQIKNKTVILAIVSKTLSNSKVIEKLISDIKDFSTIKEHYTLLVMLNDFMTTGRISGGGAIKRMILANKESIPKLETQSTTPLFKYYRMNSLVTTQFPGITNTVETDKEIPFLFKITPPLKLQIESLISQDKPSCFPAFILNPEENSECIDACAAPGNKTTHLAAIMKNTGKIYAFDKDKKRAELLQKNVEKCNAKNVEVSCNDFLMVDPNDAKYEKVKYILCDPSCSGSGILERKNLGEKMDEERLKKLAEFQTSVVLHALKFKNVKKVTYSTCSVNVEENEMVVKRVLSQNKDFKLEKALPSWERRGIKIDDELSYEDCVRVDPELDQMTGFFVALFVKND